MISSATAPTVRIPALRRSSPPEFFPGNLSGSCSFGAVSKPSDVCNTRWRCRTISKPTIQGYNIDLIHSGLPIIELPEKTPKLDGEESSLPVSGVIEVGEMISNVKAMLGSMGDGEISISAYDTAWVALVEDIHGKGGPQFPSSLQWIINNQLSDGSWGDVQIFSAHDRMINTLACVIALKSWSICPERCERGILFLRENMWRIAEEDEELMPIGFEVAFPSLIEIAKALDLEVPYDDPALQDIYAKRNLKLKRIPKEVMHKVPTTLLHSLEGMSGLDWERLLKLQCSDGSFLFSPSSTAFALMQSRDEKCLKYLQQAVERFDGGVPNVYPVDLFEHLWAVDRLERLGISRYFELEIKECMDYVYRYWTVDGICWARNSSVHDIDDTAMGFRLLRLHGYNVSSDVFRHFKKDGEFFCFAGQSNQAVTGVYNLNRASQVMLPGESILEEAKKFSYKFLREKQASEQLLDKWIITKDLPGEVEYALDFPWYASLPRVETRYYVEQYGGGSDVWIGKTLYRMPYVNNDVYLELAKSDFNQCQAIHQLEWRSFQKWYMECGLGEHGVSWDSVLASYFLAAASVFEPERAAERLGWARTTILAEAICSYFRSDACTAEERQRFIRDFLNGGDNDINTRSGWKRTGKGLVWALTHTLDRLALDASPAGDGTVQRQIRHHLRQAWEEWMMTWKTQVEEADNVGLLLVRTIELCAARSVSDELLTHPEYARLAGLTSSICNRLRRGMLLPQERGNNNTAIASSLEAIHSEMMELVQSVLQCSECPNNQTKQTFLTVAKSFYYAAHCPPATLSSHITKVLFQRVA